jgi:hypothetical protein
VLYAKPRDIDLGDLCVDVDYDADTTPRRVEITIHLPDHLTDEQVKRLEKVAETCPVRRALEAGGPGQPFCTRHTEDHVASPHAQGKRRPGTSSRRGRRHLLRR